MNDEGALDTQALDALYAHRELWRDPQPEEAVSRYIAALHESPFGEQLHRQAFVGVGRTVDRLICCDGERLELIPSRVVKPSRVRLIDSLSEPGQGAGIVSILPGPPHAFPIAMEKPEDWIEGSDGWPAHASGSRPDGDVAIVMGLLDRSGEGLPLWSIKSPLDRLANPVLGNVRLDHLF